VIVLDACRDNPFGGAFRPAQKGLSQFDAPPSSLLAFSTAPGSVAADAIGGGGQSGLYAEHLVRELGVPATRLEDALKRVRLAVRIASKGAQVPWESTSLESDVFLFPATKKLTEAELEAEIQRDLDAWNRTKGSKDTRDWIAYLQEHPSGRFAEIAQSRLAYFNARDELARATVELAAAPVSPQPETLAAVPPQGAPPVVPMPPAVLAVIRNRDPVELEVVPGRAAPMLMRPSANPLSAGTYALDRRFSVGDVVVYSTFDPVYRGDMRTEELRVSRVDLDADRIEVNGGLIVLDAMGNPIRLGNVTFDPRLQSIPVEFQLGRKWTTRFVRIAGTQPVEGYYDYHVAARERIKIAAGEFEAFRIDAEGYSQFGTQLLSVAWLVPGFNFALRSELRRRDGRSLRVIDAEAREMVSCRQLRWTQA